MNMQRHEYIITAILGVVLAATVGLFVASLVVKAGQNWNETLAQAAERPQGW